VAQNGLYERQTSFDLYTARLASKLAFGFSTSTHNINTQRTKKDLMATFPFAA